MTDRRIEKKKKPLIKLLDDIKGNQTYEKIKGRALETEC